MSISSSNLPFVEDLHEKYLQDPEAVPSDWRVFFQNEFEVEPSGPTRRLDHASANGALRRDDSVREARPPLEGESPASAFGVHPSAFDETGESEANRRQDRVDQFLRAYRLRGHLIAELDPLGQPRPVPPGLDPAFYGFTEADLDKSFSCQTVGGLETITLRNLLQRLRHTYCRSIGVEYMHIEDMQVRRWLQNRMESTENRIQLGRDEQLRILTRLTDAVVFEEFIRKKFVGAKSFSLEGSESLIPLLDLAIEKAAEQGVTEIVLGMAHRGRLNVLANIMGKHPKQIFREFADVEPERYRRSGDVKYHLGYRKEWMTASGKQLHLSLCFNPSHLEFVSPVVLGRTRGNQDRTGDTDRNRNMALVIHGDAAFAGQGVVQETLNLSQLAGYRVGGTVHVILNNQIGFTTSPSEGRSMVYASDVAKMLQIPIFHVNGENPEAVACVVRLAMDFRQLFQRDVVIDVYGYRRLGHNEGDEPSFTQPVLYRAIEQRKSVREGYLDHLLALGEVTRQEADEIAESRRAHLEKALSESRREDYKLPTEPLHGVWSHYPGGPEAAVAQVNTGVEADRLSRLLDDQTRAPASFHPHPKIKRFLEVRARMARGEAPLDWGAAEALAFGSLAAEGFRIRLTGQDCGRGTFSHRHAVLHDYENGETYIPLQHVAGNQAPVEIVNSPLSEAGALGFEYGYSLEWPDGLIVWEAQFGDFCNAAQVIIDQFLVSAEKKWRRLSGLVLLLPHGYEGQGPEHSSARLERFLAMSAEDNIQVVSATTPAQYFHLLRRQALQKWRKPLIVMAPKSLLRHPKAVSRLDELERGQFQRVLPDARTEAAPTERVLLCSGKIYFELEKRREETGRKDVAIVRLEQLYPFPAEQLEAAIEPHGEGKPLYWVQEEPENMGAARFLRIVLGPNAFGRWPFQCVSRPSSSSPATGSANSHKQEQEQLLAAAFGDEAKQDKRGPVRENGEQTHGIESARGRRVHH